MKAIRHIAAGPWMILVFLIVGWGPLFIADLVRAASPVLDAAYSPQAFGMAWMGITLLCSFLAIIFSVYHFIRFIFGGRGNNDDGRMGL